MYFKQNSHKYNLGALKHTIKLPTNVNRWDTEGKGFFTEIITLKRPISVPQLLNFSNFFLPTPQLLSGPPRLLVFAQVFQNMFQTYFLSKSSSHLVIFLCCLHSHDHRRLIYKHRVLRSSIILHFTAFFHPPPRIFRPPCLLISSDISDLPHIPTPSAIRH